MAEVLPAASTVFNQVAFHIVISENLSESLAEELATTLQNHGAEQISGPYKDGKIDLNRITHIITTTIDFENYEQATDLMIAVVTPPWVQSSASRGKVANPRSYSPDPRMIFSGMMVHIAGLPEDDKDAIIGGLDVLGGIYASQLSRQVTHIVALSVEPQACQIAIEKDIPAKIVLPHWFDDCLKLGRRISEEPYQLPDPQLLGPRNTISPQNLKQKVIGVSASVDSKDLDSSKPSITRTVFQDQKILLSSDLEIADHLRATLHGIIESGGGVVVENISEANTLVCKWREGHEFRNAGHSNITIGNLSWLYHLITTNVWSSPLRRLLHFPLSRGGIPGFENYRISLSNYSGDARLFLENLATAAGSSFTRTMKPVNTHLITAHNKSEKCDAAKDWNVHMINHLWLEESYAKWAIQSVTNPRYNHFPVGTNLGQVVGQTPIDKDALQRQFFPPPAKSTVSDAPPASAAPPKLSPARTGNVEAEEKPILASTPSIPKSSPGLSHRTRDTNATPATNRNRKSNLASELATPIPNSTGKENITPPTSGRSSKMKAMASISMAAEDIKLYEKEKKRKGGVVHGGMSSVDRVATSSMKRRASEDPEADEEELKSKKIKKTCPEPEMKLLVTGYTAWANNPTQYNKDAEQLAQLGIELTEDAAGCPFIAAPKIMRTKKFICAMAGAPTILNTDFIQDCLKLDKLLDYKQYMLVDMKGEETFQVKLNEAIKRAKKNQGQLLENQRIYVTQDVRGGADTYKEIAGVNGGVCEVFKGRATTLSSATSDEEEMSDAKSNRYVYLISGSTKPEMSLWPKFRDQAKTAGLKPRIVKTDWMLDLALCQSLRWSNTYEVKPGD